MRMNRQQARQTVPFLMAVLTGTVTWAVWNESFAVGHLLKGALLTILALGITSRYLLQAPYHELFRIRPITVVRYLLTLIIAIFESGVHAMAITITGKLDVHVVDLPTRVRNPFHGVLIANAITLTPGTVTIDHEPGTFKVVWIERPATDPQLAGDMIKGRFERVFAHEPDTEERPT